MNTPLNMTSEQLAIFVKEIPKTDLHLHLDGSINLTTIIDIAQKESIKLPSYTVEGLNELVFKDHYQNLEEYLTTFGYSCQVMQKPEYLERISYELAIENQNEGVYYIEVRFAPHLHINKDQDMREVLLAVNRGLERATQEHNNKGSVKNGDQPPFYYGIIVCALRSFDKFSDYYTKFIDTHTFSTPKAIFSLCSFELSQGAIRMRDELGIPIVGFDLAGAEKGFPAADHRKAYQFAHENFLHKTVHAGEAYGPESIFQAITELHADRIGHGFYLFDTNKIENPKISGADNKQRYVNALAQYIADRRITIEICLTSNLQTNPELKSIQNHSFKNMLEHGLCTTLCTDNRTVSKTSVSNELLLALNNFDISHKTLKNTTIYGFKRSFFAESYSNKRKYVRQIINYYDKIFSKHQKKPGSKPGF